MEKGDVFFSFSTEVIVSLFRYSGYRKSIFFFYFLLMLRMVLKYFSSMYTRVHIYMIVLLEKKSFTVKDPNTCTIHVSHTSTRVEVNNKSIQLHTIIYHRYGA